MLSYTFNRKINKYKQSKYGKYNRKRKNSFKQAIKPQVNYKK